MNTKHYSFRRISPSAPPQRFQSWYIYVLDFMQLISIKTEYKKDVTALQGSWW